MADKQCFCVEEDVINLNVNDNQDFVFDTSGIVGIKIIDENVDKNYVMQQDLINDIYGISAFDINNYTNKNINYLKQLLTNMTGVE